MFDMPYSGIKQLIGFKNLAKLTSMNLRSCEFLEKLPDLSGSPNIKHLDLRDCKSLVEVDDSVGFLCKLVELNLSGCSNLTRFVTRLGLRSLKRLYLDGCTRLENFPEIEEDEMGSLMDLDIGKSGIKELPSSIAYLTRLQTLSAEGCENLTGASLHHIYGLQRLNEVYFGDCPKLVTFGNEVKFDEVASCSTEYQLIPTDLDTTCDNRIKFSLPNLDYLDFDGCNLSEMDFLVPLDCWSTLTRLTVLNLSRNNFVSLPDCISKVANLEKLYLSGCKRLREIPQVLPPKLNYLCLNDCTSLEKIPKLPPMLKLLRLINCFRLSGDEVAKLENNLLNQESRRRSELKVILPGNEVPKWFSFTSDHLTTTEHRSKNEFRFEIPLYLLGDTLLGLALYVIIDATTPPDPNADILINGIQRCEKYLWYVRDMEATHVWLGLVDFDMRQQQGPFCEVIFHFPESARIKSCGVHCLSYEWLHLSSRPTSSLGKRTHPHRSSDIIDDAYEQQQQWLYLSPEKQRHKCDIEEEQERPSTSIDRQCVRSSKEWFNMLNLMNIEKLNWNNFKSWKQQIDMHLGMLEFNIAFTQTQPTALTETSTAAEKETFAKWERANQMSLLIMQNSMEKHITGGIQNYDLAKQYMAKIEKKYKRTDKTEIGVYLSDLINAKFDGTGSV
ncbi:disease resistance protein RPP2B-like [Malus domestica]|uniref:disease resistance protein RPP2B-like n=1 Tax=Malus domestica TaxID=3750 RepID=UPI00049928E6|nr:disease resistance protein TAO1-like [Malus domestica]